ncbi:ABC transporter permease [Rhodobacter sp. 24-YEA-8]|uniref:ABC transporter permease n=1 Tax=Rhodobacter sp. 24-YEA-8 TaxID=1884310 RepID=UPI001495BA64|nr:ABC transporter permease [Rhodobacter sp. 24-YEA-8]
MIFLLLLIAGFSIAEPSYFPTVENLVTTLNDGALLAILASGLTLVLIVGEFDISTAAMASFGGALVTVLATKVGLSMPLALLTLVAVAVSVGLLNGFLVTVLNIPALIATIGTASLLDGASLWITGNSVVFEGFTDEILWYGNWRFAGLQAGVWYMLVIAAILVLMLRYTATGRYFYAVGSNREASHMAGIHVQRQVVLAFVICAVLSGFCGFIYTSRQGSLTPLFGASMTLPAFAAVFLGYVTLAHRRFHIIGTVIGVYIIGTGTLGLLLIGAPAYSQQLFAGSVLIAATGGSRLRELLMKKA